MQGSLKQRPRTNPIGHAHAIDEPTAAAVSTADCGTVRVDAERVAGAVRTRLREALHGKSIRTIASDVQICPETVRRYLTRSTCSVEFVTKVCHRYSLSAEWLMFGRGSAIYPSGQSKVVGEIEPTQILTEIARRWDNVETRLTACFTSTSRADTSETT